MCPTGGVSGLLNMFSQTISLIAGCHHGDNDKYKPTRRYNRSTLISPIDHAVQASNGYLQGRIQDFGKGGGGVRVLKRSVSILANQF